MNIIIVEDHISFREALVEYLQCNLNHNVVETYDNGSDFIENIYSHTYNYDIILMDINMPRLDGFGATKKYDWVFHDRKILAVTMDTTISMRTLIESGFKGCIFKTEIYDKLEIAMNTVIDNKYYWTEKLFLNI